jgi:hypothetical protein
MKAKRLRLHVLAIGTGPALPALKSIAEGTAGTYTVELNLDRWLAAITRTLRAAAPDYLVNAPVSLRFLSEGSPQRSLDRANRTWLKPNASLLAEGRTDGETLPMAASHAVGAGTVIATAFAPNEAEREVLATNIARPPRDPRFRVTWTSGKVVVDALDGDRYLTDLTFALEFRSLQGTATPASFLQSAPGRYEASIAPVAQPRLAVVKLADREIDRRPIPGRYAREFDAIGADEAALRTLAERTGGRLIAPAESGPIVPKLWRDTALVPWLCGAASLLIAVGLIHWKRAG